MAYGMLGGLPPGLRGYVAAEEIANRRGMNTFGMAQGIMGMQHQAQMNPLQLAIAQHQLRALQNPPPPSPMRLGKDDVLIDPQTGQVRASNPGTPAPRAPRVQFDSQRGGTIDLDTNVFTPTPGLPAIPKEPKARRTQYDQERGVVVDLDTGEVVNTGLPPKQDKPTADQQAQVVGVNNTRNAIQTYREALKGFGALDTLNPSKRAQIGTSYNNMLLQAKEAYRLGVLNGPDYKILQEVITSPTSLMGAVTPKVALEDQLTQLDQIMERVGQTAQQGGRGAVPPERRQGDRRGSTSGFRVIRD